MFAFRELGTTGDSIRIVLRPEASPRVTLVLLRTCDQEIKRL